MIKQFGTRGYKLENGEFLKYEITINGEWAGEVYKTFRHDWAWSIETGYSDDVYAYNFETARQAIDSIKKYLLKEEKQS